MLQATHHATGQEYAIKIIDKAHLLRHHKLQTAHAEKNTLIRLRPGHPGIVRLHAAFHDEWSLCTSLPRLKLSSQLVCKMSQVGEELGEAVIVPNIRSPLPQHFTRRCWICWHIRYTKKRGACHRSLLAPLGYTHLRRMIFLTPCFELLFLP